ncbi:MAG: hypothetical protein P4L61_02050 [Candidatus Pacebacteria bacterium]|nr:hypothetical protein [Candidatus Paceibacterota bacterium]
MKKSTQVISAIVIAAVFFGAGWLIKGSASASTSSTAARSGASGFTGTAGSFAGAAGARTGRTAGAGLVAGTVVAVDPTSISIALPNSTSTSATTGSTVVLYSTGTSVLKSVIGSPADLSVGENVTVQGTSNSDGSMSATAIQIRPSQPGQ